LKCKKVVDKTNFDLIKSVIHSDFTPKYNPLQVWFDKNKGLRPQGNVTKLAACIESDLKLKDANFIEYFLEKWLLSIIASAHGIYSILCLVLTGQVQGTGKTNFFRELLPEDLRWLFAINKLDLKNEGDIAQLMCSKLLILDDEFGGKSKQDEKKFKELISKDVFTVRMPYGHYFKDMRRLSVLCGTTNEEQVINDLTGNRRIIPFQINYIDEQKFSEIDKTELFIELYWKFRENPKAFFLTKSDIERLNEVCYDANQVAPELELPLKYFKKSTHNEPGGEFLSASEIRSVIEQHSGIRLSSQKMSVTMKTIGYECDRQRIEGVQCRGFWVKKNYLTTPELPNIPTNDDDKINKLPF
jgi:predicted P-loop ATPase